MAVFRRLVYAALCAGLVSGFFAAAAHQIGTVPLIIEAETYERAAPHPATEADAHAAENSIERAAYTLAADLLTAIGFALLLASGLTLRGGAVSWRDGLFWGLAGFATFTLAPGIGLPPEIPGTEAGRLRHGHFVLRDHYRVYLMCTVAFDPQGNLWVASGQDGQLLKIDQNGNVLGAVGNGSGTGEGQFIETNYMVWDKQGNLYTGDTSVGRVTEMIAPKKK